MQFIRVREFLPDTGQDDNQENTSYTFFKHSWPFMELSVKVTQPLNRERHPWMKCPQLRQTVVAQGVKSAGFWSTATLLQMNSW